MNRLLSKEDTQIDNKHRKRYSTSLAIRKMQIKATVIYHFTPTRMAVIKKAENYKHWPGGGEIGTLTLWWAWELV